MKISCKKISTLTILKAGKSLVMFDSFYRTLYVALFGFSLHIKLPDPINRLKDEVEDLRKLSPFRQYYWYSSTDCDHMHVEYAVSYANGWIAESSMNREYDNAEGPMSFTRMSRSEWNEYKHGHITDDRAARNMNY
jgi:hypothetical protein